MLVIVSPMEMARYIEGGKQVRRKAGAKCVRGKLSLVEEAVAKILPRWPEAYAAVMAYAEARAARLRRGGRSDETDGNR